MDKPSMMRLATAETVKFSGNSSDSNEENVLPNCPAVSEDNLSGDGPYGARFCHDDSASPTSFKGYNSGAERGQCLGSSRSECEDEGSPQRFDLHRCYMHRRTSSDHIECEGHDCSANFAEEEDTMTSEQTYSPIANEDDNAKSCNAAGPMGKPNFSVAHRCDEDSSRIHVFYLSML